MNLEIIKVYGMGSRVKSASLLLIILLALLLQAGCTHSSSGGTEGGLSPALTSTPVGTSSIEPETPWAAPKVSLSDALKALPAAEGIDIGGLTLTEVWGYGVDSSGLARTWVLGMQGNGKNTLLTYSEGQFTELDLPTTLPLGEVKFGTVLTPEDLFRKDMKSIVGAMNNLRVGECDLVLDENSYQVIVRSGTESKALTFDAKTGELKASP
jgi:hypothetical protein